jgi:hypothetical protein
MEHLGSIFVVFAILLVVTIAAFSFEPAKPFAAWVRLAEHYATERRPSQIEHTGQKILFGDSRGRLKGLNDFVTFDATIDDFGLWLICKGIDSEQFPAALKIPGTHIRSHGQHGQTYLFDLYAEPPVRISARGELGAALMEKTHGA